MRLTPYEPATIKAASLAHFDAPVRFYADQADRQAAALDTAVSARAQLIKWLATFETRTVKT
ncbi:MAG: hypothetical protein QM533_00640 [Cytophagales bacterium]|nr:hypothetical protein [Cytophagales bacterium]